MPPAALFYVPLLRPLLRALIFAVTLETIFHRLLAVPGAEGSGSLLEAMGASTVRAGSLMFVIAAVLLIASLVALAHGAMRTPLWRGWLNTPIAVGILTLCALTISASTGPRGPLFAAIFTMIALMVHLAMLAVMYDSQEDRPGKLFSLSLGGGMLCMSLSSLAVLTDRLPWSIVPVTLAAPALTAGRWFLIGAGLAAYAVFFRPAGTLGRLSPAATYGLPAVAAFALIAGVLGEPSVLGGFPAGLLGENPGLVETVLTTGAAAAALFLVTATSIGALADPFHRPRAYGLLLLLFSGYPHQIAYQHLMAVLGVALITVEEVPVQAGPRHGVGDPGRAGPPDAANDEGSGRRAGADA